METNTPQTPDFERLITLLSTYTAASHQLARMEAEMNNALIALTSTSVTEYAALQLVVQDTEKTMEVLATAHPEWFAAKKSITTPYGTVKFHQSSSLDIGDEENAIMLIEAKAQEIQDDADGEMFDPELYIKTTRSLNLEALEKLDDGLLMEFGITRKQTQNFSVKAAKVPMATAVKAAQKAAQAKPESEVAS